MTVIKEKSRQWTLIFGLTVVLSMTAFFMMYLINNEYTAKGEQPIQGILCLDDKDAAAKLHYLAREWQYFPGKLLTPEMLKKDPGYYSCYFRSENVMKWNWGIKRLLRMDVGHTGCF